MQIRQGLVVCAVCTIAGIPRPGLAQRALYVDLLANEGYSGELKVWEPVEWTFANPTCDGNPYDLLAAATFTHTASGERITTELFYNGSSTWKLRFTGTKPGEWTFATVSSDADLNGLTGSVTLQPNPGVPGFMTKYAGGNRWGRLGVDEAFVPQHAMYASPKDYHGNPAKIDADLSVHFGDHGFNGLHTSVMCAWFDINKTNYDEIPSMDPNPDPRTFEALELLMAKVHKAGGVVHIWAWGDEQRHMTPAKWGTNGPVDQRLQRYICARLGPMPGWSMGYGFDLQEWAGEEALRVWHDYMHARFGWQHFLGARAPDMTQISEDMDYSSYQQHRPTYDMYVQGIEQLHPGKPTFFEDRFRVRENVYPEKDYSLDMTRRGLWHSTMAGGAANIWGYLINPPADGSSGVYPNKHELLTYARFFRQRFRKEMVRDNSLTNGVCLKAPASLFVFYKEDTSSITMNLSSMGEPRKAVAVDAKKRYEEIPLGTLAAAEGQVFNAPYASDWAVAVGDPASSLPLEIDLGRIDKENGLYRVDVSDGDTIVVDAGGRNCRRNADLAGDRYMYFNVSGAYAYEGSRPELYITIEYFDEGSGGLKLQYDAAGGAYTDGGTVNLTASNTWKRHSFHVTDARLANRQNNGADVRIERVGQGTFYLNEVEVSHLPPGPPSQPSQPDPPDQSSGVDRNAQLSWTAADAVSYIVYFGPAGALTFQGNQTDASFSPGPLAGLTGYSWRVDAVNEYGVTTGVVWSFTTAPLSEDYDADGDVDLGDFGWFQACMSGPGAGYAHNCGGADLDGDLDVDAHDFLRFIQCLGGASVMPTC